MKLSVIIPCKNEEGNVEKLYLEFKNTLKDVKYELIFIDDGSTDNTLNILKEIYNNDKKCIKILSFSRNFKKEAAMLAGLHHSTGKYTCIVDGDLQQNPSYLLEMVDFLDNNNEYDEVAMVVKNRNNENKIMSLCKKCFYKLIDKLSDIHFEENASDFRMFRENVKDAIISLNEVNRFSKGIFSFVGFNVKYLTYEVEKRNSGTSSFGFINSVKYALSGIIDFSTKPLKLSLLFGIIAITISLVYLLINITNLEIENMIIVLLLLFSGLQFIFISIIGAYISNIQSEVKNRPKYIIKEKIGFKED